MTRFRVNAFGISMDGFGAGVEQSLENPMGSGGLAMHGWAFETKTFRAMHRKLKAGARALMRNLRRGVLRMSARGFWGGICSGRCADRGGTGRGRDGGEIRRRTMCRCLC